MPLYCHGCQTLSVEARRLEAELATLRAKVAELEKDRERLDWIFADPFAVLNVKGAYNYEEVEDRGQLDAARASAAAQDVSEINPYFVVDAVVKDLTDRRGLRQEWEQIDEEIQQEIREAWAGIVESEIQRARAAQGEG